MDVAVVHNDDGVGGGEGLHVAKQTLDEVHEESGIQLAFDNLDSKHAIEWDCWQHWISAKKIKTDAGNTAISLHTFSHTQKTLMQHTLTFEFPAIAMIGCPPVHSTLVNKHQLIGLVHLSNAVHMPHVFVWCVPGLPL